ncbi:unnamed protein product [Periconia digitata]|uniref:Uncharacterized protein n=1 Tax=Periconia digitata TaxID=1303443 RepID=A0A9W4UTA3_9PLEO|nr:unnamed protein product [Periconia digitata]
MCVGQQLSLAHVPSGSALSLRSNARSIRLCAHGVDISGRCLLADFFVYIFVACSRACSRSLTDLAGFEIGRRNSPGLKEVGVDHSSVGAIVGGEGHYGVAVFHVNDRALEADFVCAKSPIWQPDGSGYLRRHGCGERQHGEWQRRQHIGGLME